MRRLKISHVTEYRFHEAVILQPHILRLRPREGPEVHIESSALGITPEYRVKWHRDVFDNAVATVDFLEPAETLNITSEVVIEHYGENPLDFLVEDYAVNYPFHYAPQDRPDLAPFLHPSYPGDENRLREWLIELGLKQPAMQSYSLLDQLCRTIRDRHTYQVREEPGVQSPAETLDRVSGSCRDLAALFIETCRYLGLASRFISGYAYSPQTEQWSAATHAWAEVYLPGPGWKGFDPTSGGITGSAHIPVAVARHPETVPPVAGNYLGPAEPRPKLLVDVRVDAL